MGICSAGQRPLARHPKQWEERIQQPDVKGLGNTARAGEVETYVTREIWTGLKKVVVSRLDLESQTRPEKKLDPWTTPGSGAAFPAPDHLLQAAPRGADKPSSIRHCYSGLCFMKPKLYPI
ncbi:hypothetical protein HJG60_011763 [Phyllostomus discolor]|uniref:Uncharacterized protein n=1 Tax=Phyllostomus discolor TaxID=89673 RepID=A0A833ZE04_9CHIR|nr:hypothetical protein HJG60_011763 [Phyllostomus discolor]